MINMVTQRLLIVDDEPLNLTIMGEILSDEYPLSFATNGEMALSAARKLKPSLILLDVQMPKMDGLEVCRQLKADPELAAIPVIFITGLTDVCDETNGFDAGAVDYITKPVSPAIVRARVHTHLSLVHTNCLEQSYRDAITMLGTAGHYNDTDTGVHIWRMAAYAKVLALAAGCSKEKAQRLEVAAPMHDTGKIGVPKHILQKPAKLEPDEWEIMKKHTQIGYNILRKSQAPVFRLAAEVALRHHEKWDGSGYPDGLAAEAIPESARIVALADVFDALTMQRPYKPAWPIEKACEQIRLGSGNHFEPRLVDLFESTLPEILEVKDKWDSKESKLDAESEDYQ